jgi:hypothetical protein
LPPAPAVDPPALVVDAAPVVPFFVDTQLAANINDAAITGQTENVKWIVRPMLG